MPIYTLECNKCGKIWDETFPMKGKKEKKCGCGGRGKRIFTVPNVHVGKIDPWNLNALTQKTANMKGSVGDLWNFSKEQSQKRGGDYDPIRKKALQDYANLRGGKQYRDGKEELAVEFRVVKNGSATPYKSRKGRKAKV